MKGNLLQGTARGRMGDIVAKVLHGQQVFAKYQPVVFNPKSPLQRINRDRLALTTKAYKENVHEMVLSGFDFRYNLYSGASKSFRNIFYNFVMQCQDIGENGANHRKVNFISPLIVNNTIGNLLVPVAGSLGGNDLFPQFVKDINMPVKQYFGSDVPLTDETRIIVLGTDEKAPFYQVLNSVGMNLQIAQEDRSTAIGLSKNFGLQESLLDCGEWDYIYSFESELDSGASGMLYSESTTKIGLYYFWVDKNGRIISSGSLEKDGVPTPTP